MLSPSLLFSRLTLPVLFFGYAAAANVAILSGIDVGQLGQPLNVSTLLDGSVAAALDSAYKRHLPHRQQSIGLIGAGRYLAFGEGREGVVVGTDGWLFTKEEFEQPTQPQTYVANAANRVHEVHNRLAAKGVALLVVPLPAKADLYRDRLDQASVAGDLEARYRAFRAALAQRGVDVSDPRPDLVAEQTKQPVFLQTDTHWTPAGASVVARDVSRSVPQFVGDGGFTIEQTGTIEVRGDLTKFISDGAYPQLIGLAPETVATRQAVQPEGVDAAVNDIFGAETTIPTVLVGTSYSANDTWGFVEDLKASLRSDVLNVAEQGRGPVFPMLKYLASDSFRTSPPKLVVWEFPIRYLAQADLWDSLEGAAVDIDSVAIDTTPKSGDSL